MSYLIGKIDEPDKAIHTEMIKWSQNKVLMFLLCQ